jgi:methylase of polypeptide subunit release factors
MNVNPIQHIAKLQARKIPYTVEVLGTSITINSHDAYPSGKLAEFFLSVLLDKVEVMGKNIADIGAGCSTLGIVMAKHGAGQVIGVDICSTSVECSKFNIDKHSCKDKVQIHKGEGVDPLKNYNQYFDFIVSGIPWSTMSQREFDKLPENDKAIYQSFFDVEDKLITSLLEGAWPLLKKRGYIYITACLAIMTRVKGILKNHDVNYSIIAQKDIHNDGNYHYILKLNQKEKFYDEF